MAWFTVRTFFRYRPCGRPRHRDASYRPRLASVEERVVLVQADDFEAALRRGEEDAREYAERSSTNIYGQEVVKERLDFIEAYALDGDPSDGAEVFSYIELVSARETTARILARKLGQQSGPESAHMFIAAEISRELGLPEPGAPLVDPGAGGAKAGGTRRQGTGASSPGGARGRRDQEDPDAGPSAVP